MSTTTRTTLDFLGGKKYIKISVNNRMDYISLARQGLPKGVLDSFIENSLIPKNILYNALPLSKRTIQRYTTHTKLSKLISEMLIEWASLCEKGIEVFEDEKTFIEWMSEKNTSLGQKPINLIDTTIGISLIKDELGRIEYGVYS